MKLTAIKHFSLSARSSLVGLLSLVLVALIEEIIKTNTYNKPSTEVLAIAGLPLAYLPLFGFALLTTKTRLKLNLIFALGLSVAFGLFFAAALSHNKDYVLSFLIPFFAGLISFVPVAISQNYLMRKYAQQGNQGDWR